MPPFETHLKASEKRTGNEYRELHDWLDNHPDSKKERHDLDRLPENRDYVVNGSGAF